MGEQALFYYLAIQFTLKSILGGFIVIIGCMELYRVIKRDEPIKELGHKIDGMKEYVTRLEEELKETGAVHRTIYVMHHEMNALRQREREKELQIGELQKNGSVRVSFTEVRTVRLCSI